MPETSKQDVEFLKQFEPDVFWQQHGKKILAGVAVVALVGLGFYYRQRQVADREEAAATEIAAARDPATLQRLAQEFRGQSIGAQALLRLADAQAQIGHYKEAGEAFQTFLTQFPSHPLVESAQLGLATVQEAQGDFQGAKTQYQQIVSGHPTGYTALAAKLGQARCEEGLGLTKEAQQTYEELRAVIRGSPWETEVFLRSMVLARSQPAVPTTSAVPPEASSIVIPIGGGTTPQP